MRAIHYEKVTDEKKFEKLAHSPFFHDRDIITEDIVGVHMLKPKVILDKPVFVGQAVLDYSKIEMYNLFYTLRQLLWCYAMFGPTEGEGGDPFFHEAAYDTWLVLSLCCGNPGSMWFWLRARSKLYVASISCS